MLSHLLKRCQAIRARCASLRGEGGGALVELAIMLALLGVPLLLGTADIATLIYSSIEVSNAAHAGAIYGMQSAADANNSADIIIAAQDEASDIPTANMNVTPSVFYACSASESGTQYPGTTEGEAEATSDCAGAGNHPLEFVQVVAAVSVTPPFHCPGLPATLKLRSTSVMEVEE